jgi:oxygen-independent coproporphyrinogen-3 oxidase
MKISNAKLAEQERGGTQLKQTELYIHTPFCVHKCAYCDFLSFPGDEKTQEQYVQSLRNEIRYFGEKMQDYEITTIYIGGGTPSWLSQELMLSILDETGDAFHIRRDAEVTIECNPGTLTESKLSAYRAAGVNRLSIGLQSADNKELKMLDRIHTFEQFMKTYEMSRSAGFANINVDLMNGLPYQTVKDYLKSLLKVIRIRPEHISSYSLIIEKGTPFYNKYKFDAVKQEIGMETEMLPNEDELYRMLKVTQYELAEAGYEQYEISNYARPGYACRHNIGYWTRENYLGLGLGAASLIENVRYSNTRDLYEYMSNSENIREVSCQEMTGEDPKREGEWFGTNLHASAEPILRKHQMEEFMFLGLRMTKGIARSKFEECFSIPIEGVYYDVIEELKAEGLLAVRAGRIALTDRGLDLSNYAMSKFLF